MEGAEALAEAWSALDLAPGDLGAKRRIAQALRYNPDLIAQERRADLLRLLTDPDVDPDAIASAGWTLILAGQALEPGKLPDDGRKARAHALTRTVSDDGRERE